MSARRGRHPEQVLFAFAEERDARRRGLDELFAALGAFRAGGRFLRLLACMGRFRDYGPYNALLAAVQRPDDSEPQFFSGLSHTMCEDILALCEDFDTDPCFYTTQSLYYGRAVRSLLRRMEQNGRVIMDETADGYFYIDSREEWEKVLETEPFPFAKAILYPSHDISDLLVFRLTEMGHFELAPSVMFGGELHNIEINRRGVNKGQSLRWLAKTLGLTMENVVAIGDSDNDLTMLRAAGLGIAMGNAAQNIRLTADAVTASNAECGVAQAIETYILEEKL